MRSNERAALAESLAALHFDSLSKEDFSKKLGQKAIRIFYEVLLSSAYGRVFFSKHKSGEIVSLCCVFIDYPAFQTELKIRLLPLIVVSLITRRLKFSSLVSELKRGKGDISSELIKFHLGMIVSNSSYGPAATKQLLENFGKAIDYAKKSGIAQLWASTLTSNNSALKFLQKNNFIEFDRRADIVYLLCHI